MFGMFRPLFSSNIQNVNLCLRVFDKLIKSIALYGSQAWIQDRPFKDSLFQKCKTFEFELLQSQFCKRVLGISRMASSLVARGELGRYPLSITTLNQMAQYWLHLHNHSSNIIKSCLSIEKNLDAEGIHSLPTVIRKLTQWCNN